MLILAVWQNHDAVSAVVAKEAQTLNDLFRDTESYPEFARGPLREELKAHARALGTMSFILLIENYPYRGPSALQPTELSALLGDTWNHSPHKEQP
jgi:hypothetical protein